MSGAARMSGSRAFASLSSSLLARKGGARPAMRSALTAQSDGRPHDPLADLGWNDMGEAAPPAALYTPAYPDDHPAGAHQAEARQAAEPVAAPTLRAAEPVVVFEPAVPAPSAEPLLARKPVAAEVVQLVREVPVARPDPRPDAPAPLTVLAGAPLVRRTRPAAFTLRLDPDRHLRLRTACALQGRSAQGLVTEAVDRFLDAMPDLRPAQRTA